MREFTSICFDFVGISDTVSDVSIADVCHGLGWHDGSSPKCQSQSIIGSAIFNPYT